jgi:type I restriction enzyme M protein
LPEFATVLDALTDTIQPFLDTLADDSAYAEVQKELAEALPVFNTDVEEFRQSIFEQEAAWRQQKTTNGDLKEAVNRLALLADSSCDLIKQTDLLYKLASRLIETCENECNAKVSDAWVGKDVTRTCKAADEARQTHNQRW